MENIKNLMGDKYHDGVTLEEINAFLDGKKLVNLNDGGYVAKDKFERIESEKKQLLNDMNTLKEQTKDYETLKSENETFKTEKADASLREKVIKLGIKESAYKYVKGDIVAKELELGDDDKANAENVKKYLEAHPEFATPSGDNGGATIVKKTVGTSVEGTNGEGASVNEKLHKMFNDK